MSVKTSDAYLTIDHTCVSSGLLFRFEGGEVISLELLMTAKGVLPSCNNHCQVRLGLMCSPINALSYRIFSIVLSALYWRAAFFSRFHDLRPSCFLVFLQVVENWPLAHESFWERILLIMFVFCNENCVISITFAIYSFSLINAWNLYSSYERLSAYSFNRANHRVQACLTALRILIGSCFNLSCFLNPTCVL